jgi:hypothetical protein
MVFFVGDRGCICGSCSERETWAGHFAVLFCEVNLVLDVLVGGSFLLFLPELGHEAARLTNSEERQ